MSSTQQGQGDETTDGDAQDETATVLIVEDQEQIANAYTRALSAEYDVHTATSGQEALEKVDDDIDVILLDRRMPEMSGDEVLEQLREQGIQAKVAMVTAVKPDTDILEMEFDEYLTKPAGTQELREVTEVLLERAACESDCQEIFRLSVKKIALENANKDWTDAYEEICDRLEQRREKRETTIDEQLLPEACGFH